MLLDLNDDRSAKRNAPSLDPLSRWSPEVDTGNAVLAALPTETRHAVLARCEAVSLRQRQVLQEFGLPAPHIVFIEDGLASLFARPASRESVEVCALGRHDVTGACMLLGAQRSAHRCVVQVPGHGLRIATADLLTLIGNDATLRRSLLNYIQSLLTHATYLTVCSAAHSAPQRTARWLLLASEQLGRPWIPVTHQMISRSLGVRRATITEIVGDLENQRLLRRRRGEICVQDRDGLERTACDCVRGFRLLLARHRSEAS